MRHFSKTIILGIILTSIGCSPRAPKNPQEVAGDYVFGYARTKELEVVIINPDYTYKQELYKDLDSYHNSINPVYTNSGRWSNSNNVIFFQSYLAFCEAGNPEKRLFPPRTNVLYEVSWFPKNSERDASLLVSSELSYGFIRVTNRAEVR